MRLAAIATLLLSTAAFAEDPPQFGRTGQAAPIGSVGFAYLSSGSTSATVVSLSPGVLFFPADHFAVDLQLSVQSLSPSGERSTTSWSAGAQVGGSIDLDKRASMLLLGGLQIGERPSGFGDTAQSFALTAQAPLLFHVAAHFFLGFGPSLVYELSAKSGGAGVATQTIVAVQSVLGGWI